ncbi:hypothetical protein BpHYR1_023285 [Brachionus plicatilis]|uniref:Uncharacterized protein n=1 Tax=Brachionus plicatilis TaxID=10195 RepID=A0A3M7PJW1_BRAPC|nr:hypothetical protein BpHYR1_023285 [Brachionus plicatilis]
MRNLQKKALGSHTAVRKPLHNIKDKQKRYNWCIQRLNWTSNISPEVLYTKVKVEGQLVQKLIEPIPKRRKNKFFQKQLLDMSFQAELGMF